MEFLQKINRMTSAGFFRRQGVAVFAGMFFCLFFIAVLSGIGPVSQPIASQMRGGKAVQIGHEPCTLAALQGNSFQLLQNIRRGQRTSSQQYSSAWRLRALLLFSPFAVMELLHSQEWFLEPQGESFSFQRYLQSSLPVRAGPFHS